MQHKLPQVCICLPTYNAELTIRETLLSILAQTYPNLVISVSDNASTDETLKIIESMTDSRVTIYRNDENVGGYGNLNRCIKLARGKYTAIFHADDIYEPDIVAKQVEFLEDNPRAGAVFTAAALIDDVGYRFGEIQLPHGIVPQRDGLYEFESMFKAVLHHSNFFICPSFMVRTNIYQEEIIVWRENKFGSSADLDVWFRILQKHPIGHLPKKLIRYRISNNQFSARIRVATEPSDFFKVINYYIGQSHIKEILKDRDLCNLKCLERRDRVVRAVNFFILSCPQEARQLLDDIYSKNSVKAAFKSKRGFLVLIVGMSLRFLIVLGLNKIGKILLIRLKNIASI